MAKDIGTRTRPAQQKGSENMSGPTGYSILLTKSSSVCETSSWPSWMLRDRTLNKRWQKIDKRLEEQGQQFEEQGEKFEELQAQTDDLQDRHRLLKDRVTRLEHMLRISVALQAKRP